MKKETVRLEEMNNLEVEEFLEEGGDTVIIPIGSMEQHGGAGPLSTDVLIPDEIGERVAKKIGAVVAPPLYYCLSYPHRGFTSEFSIEIETFERMVGDLCMSFARAGFKRIIFLNGHFDNGYPCAYGILRVKDDLPEDVKAFPLNLWDGQTEEHKKKLEEHELNEGLHANCAEISAVLAINPELVDMEKANEEFLEFPEYRASSQPAHTAFFWTSPGSFYESTISGTSGDQTKATEEKGEVYLDIVEDAVLTALKDIEDTFESLPKR